MTLEPIDPETALELYLDQKETEVAVATLRSHRSRLGYFIRWCDDREITNLNELTGRKIHEYRLWRRNNGDLSKVSLKTQMDTLRVFVRWLGTIDAVDPELHVKIQSPDLRPGDNVREVMLDSEDAEAALGYFERYEYASLPHVTMALLWHTMMRMGVAHALDVDDYSSEDQYVAVVHRPDEGTPIKNGTRGERLVGLSGQLCMLLDDWLRDRRPDVTDEHDREPLLRRCRGGHRSRRFERTLTGIRSRVSTDRSVRTDGIRTTAKRLEPITSRSVRRALVRTRSGAATSRTT